jgi:hypothetical protein
MQTYADCYSAAGGDADKGSPVDHLRRLRIGSGGVNGDLIGHAATPGMIRLYDSFFLPGLRDKIRLYDPYPKGFTDAMARTVSLIHELKHKFSGGHPPDPTNIGYDLDGNRIVNSAEWYNDRIIWSCFPELFK